MSLTRTTRLAIGIPLAVVLLVVAAPWVYLRFIRADTPDRLGIDGGTTASTAATGGSSQAAGPFTIDGTWKVGSGSEAGYRVEEILFGQAATAVGRTSNVTGELAIDGRSVTAGSFSVDLASVASDESRRDNQFRTRIMDVARFPTATFRLTQPIDLASVPEGGPATVRATGDLTLRGTTKPVTVALQAQRSGSGIEVAGSIPIVFEEWGIPNPSFGPARTEDRGDIEFKLVFAR